MDAKAAVSQAIDECPGRFQLCLRTPSVDEWQTHSEAETKGSGDGEALVVWCIERAWELHPAMEILLVWGVTLEGGGHVWIELVDGDKVYWADPMQKRGPKDAFRYTRTPWMAARFDGNGFGPLFIYLPRKCNGRPVEGADRTEKRFDSNPRGE